MSKVNIFIYKIRTLIPPFQMADEGAALAPHGVPANPVPRVPSNINMAHEQQQHYGATGQEYQGQDTLGEWAVNINKQKIKNKQKKNSMSM